MIKSSRPAPPAPQAAEPQITSSNPLLPAELSEDRAAAFHEDESAALADDRRRAVTSTHSADDGERLQTVAVAPTHSADDTFGGALGRRLNTALADSPVM
jgi:hypothetical protein